MKQSTKDTINELIKRERNSEVGETIPDSTIDSMIRDIEYVNLDRKIRGWFLGLIVFVYAVTLICSLV